MKHTSRSIQSSPIEFLNITPINSLLSKCQIKVCYVGEEPNRNRSVITKEVATQMANSLPGCPIVGYYNEDKEDFEEHNRIIEISNGEFKIKDTTRPYGFVDLNAKVWFEKFLDDEEVEHEYLCTEGWLWTKVYPEARRVITHGNNQSMELDEDTLKAEWSEDDKGYPEFFIINEALISKLCILGEENEPCFEGSQITSSFSLKFSEAFEQKLYSMMSEIQQYLKEGGTKVFTVYAVNIGDALWTSLYSHIEATYPDAENEGHSVYSISGVYEDEGQKFAILQNASDSKYYRLNFSVSETGEFAVEGELVEATDYTAPETPLFSAEEVDAFIVEYKKKKGCKNSKGKKDEDDPDENEEDSEDDDEEEDDEDKKKKKKYSLDDVVEYQELLKNFSELEAKAKGLEETITNLEAQLAPLAEFKAASERKDKEAMIATFYMLSDEDKKDVIDNIDTYSLEDIESKLSVICVRKKVNFSEEDEDNFGKGAVTYNLGGNAGTDNGQIPAWVQAAMNVAKNLEN